jgi:hypothetical protein
VSEIVSVNGVPASRFPVNYCSCKELPRGEYQVETRSDNRPYAGEVWTTFYLKCPACKGYKYLCGEKELNDHSRVN